MKNSKKKSVNNENKKPVKKVSKESKSASVKPACCSMSGSVWKYVSLLLAIVIIAGLIWLVVSKSEPKKPVSATGEKVLDMYVMSQCVYGVQAESEAINAVKKFDGTVELNVHYIVTSTAAGFQSLSGQPEVDENMRQLCINEEYDDKFFDYLLCFNTNYRSGVTQYLSCADKLNINLDVISKCVDEKGAELLKASEQKSNAVGAMGSPTIYVNNALYNSGRSELDFTRYFCNILEYDHSACENIPKPVEFNIKILSSKDCTSCDTNSIKASLAYFFPGAKFIDVELNTADGKKLVEDFDLEFLPAYILDAEVATTDSWKTQQGLADAFEQVNGQYKILDEAAGASWIIDQEKRNAFLASIGIVKGDNRPQIDFFVMSYCPYGDQAEEAIAPVYELLKGTADFNPRYVIYSNYGSGYPAYCLESENVLCSMHGVVELNQNIREACVAKYVGMDEWFEFALAMNDACNYQNADTCWTGVADQLGLDKSIISTCQAEEGAELMAFDKSMGDILGVRGSPTVFIDGELYTGPRTANGYLAGLCAAFENAPAECQNVLVETTTQVPTGSC